MFWVISVYFNIRNTLPKSSTFLLGPPVYGYTSNLFAFTACGFFKRRVNFTTDLFNITVPKKSQNIWNDIALHFSVAKSVYCLRNVVYTSDFTNSNYESKLNEQLNIAARSIVYRYPVFLAMLLKNGYLSM